MWYKLKKIMMRPNGVEKQVRPSWWEPTENTLVYLPLNQEEQLTNLWTLTKTFSSTGVNWWANYVELPSYWTWVYSYQNQPANDYSEWTMSIWCNITAMSHQWHYWCVIMWINNYWAWDNKNVDVQQNVIAISGWTQYTLNYANYYNVWHNLVVTSDGAYLDWSPLTIAQSWSGSTINTYNILLGKNPRVSNSYWIKGKLSEFIFEKRKRSQQEAINYRNQTKSNYWL